MAVTLPPKTDDAALAAWYLELVRQLQEMQRRIEELERANN